MALTILAHPYSQRVGQIVRLDSGNVTEEVDGTRVWKISRTKPLFHGPYAAQRAAPLEAEGEEAFKEFVSNSRPLCIAMKTGSSDVTVWPELSGRTRCGCELVPPAYHTLYATRASGGRASNLIAPATHSRSEHELCSWLEPVHQPRSYSPSDVRSGIVLLFSWHVGLVLHEWHDFEEDDRLLSEGFSRLINRKLSDSQVFEGFLGESAGIRRARRQVDTVAVGNEPALILGETGTGKEPATQALHLLRERKGKLVSVNTSSQAKDPAFFSTALFGRADSNEPGLADKSNHGTLFLDEIANAHHDAQATLLRFVEDGEVRPEGGSRTHHVDVRVVFATNRDPSSLKHDLLARLMHRIHLPPLRERKDDVGRLLLHLLGTRLNARGEGGRLVTPSAVGAWLSAELVCALAAAPLRFNVRDLEKVATRIAGGRQLPESVRDLSTCQEVLDEVLEVESPEPETDPDDEAKGSDPSAGEPPDDLIDRFRQLGWNQSKLEQALGEDRSKVRRWLHDKGYRFVEERRDEVLQRLRDLESAGSEGDSYKVAVELETSKHALKQWLKGNADWLVQNGLNEQWLKRFREP